MRSWGWREWNMWFQKCDIIDLYTQLLFSRWRATFCLDFILMLFSPIGIWCWLAFKNSFTSVPHRFMFPAGLYSSCSLVYIANVVFLKMFLGHCDSNWWKVARVYLMRVPYCFRESSTRVISCDVFIGFTSCVTWYAMHLVEALPVGREGWLAKYLKQWY